MQTKWHIPVLVLLSIVVITNTRLCAQSKSTVPIQGTFRTIFEMLREVPGIEIKTSNDKTGGSVVIRGLSSLTNQRPPLIVIDGVIYTGDLSNINPQDVDAISVIKDAASATAFGAQGSAGVILITTQKGQGLSSKASVVSHEGSAYTYFIENKIELKIFGQDEKVIIEGVPQKQIEESLLFIVKRKEVKILIKDIKRVEMIRD